MHYENTTAWALQADKNDPLRAFRKQFHFPTQADGKPYLYFCGNSLGLQPKSTAIALRQELDDWKKHGVEGHFHARTPWMPYHEYLTDAMARLVGAKPREVIVMNTLSVNLHLMMVSFYRPTAKRYKIIFENDAFPSDRYAIASQARFHGFDPAAALVPLFPRNGEECLRMEDIQATIEAHKDELALVMIGNTNYYTGQFFDMKKITAWGHAAGAYVGFDCAHGAGNVELNLHDSGADFAVWCTYKYLNSGPGSLGGCFIHERHTTDSTIPRFEGWWGHNKSTRFGMRDDFDPILSAEAWQLSNPPILSMAAVKASIEIFDAAGMANLRQKSLNLTGYLEFLLDSLADSSLKIITPRNPAERGCQLSLQVAGGKSFYNRLTKAGIIADWREPDVIRIAPAPLYNSFSDVFNFVQIFKDQLTA